ncbi:hypothetical protein AVEN_214438-1 [Araneus ventricosus]|uniref:Uncharacterized protein n=1 Tax=Araneus ventricosus TaxID=182803 RepID=A0A4Y2MZ09_ARAVE|nr:hypothetical protein AVEN_214438-1 [Araneus ventricosus]
MSLVKSGPKYDTLYCKDRESSTMSNHIKYLWMTKTRTCSQKQVTHCLEMKIITSKELAAYSHEMILDHLNGSLEEDSPIYDQADFLDEAADWFKIMKFKTTSLGQT